MKFKTGENEYILLQKNAIIDMVFHIEEEYHVTGSTTATVTRASFQLIYLWQVYQNHSYILKTLSYFIFYFIIETIMKWDFKT